MNQTQNIKLSAEISATSKGLVEALNKATGAINDTASNWKSRFDRLKDSTSMIGQSVKNLADLVSQVGKVDMDVEGLDKIHANIAEVSGAFDKVKGEVDTFVTTLSELKLAASDIGMPVEEYQRFSDAVKASGVQMSEAVAMVKTMQSNISDFANGIPEAQQMFAKLGISLEQLSSNTITGNLSEIARAINDTIPASERATANMQLFKSSIDSTLSVVDQYNKATSRQHGEYASDKDVQNAIGLSNAIGMLGERLNTYISKTSDATTVNNGFSRSLEDMWDKVKRDQNLLASLSVEYENYVESLKSSVTTTLDASKAIEVFAQNVEALRKESANIDADRSAGEVIPEETLNKAISNLGNLVNFLRKSKETIKDEIDAIIAIMHQRSEAGAPVDTKELEVAISHVDMLQKAIASLADARDNLNLGIPDEILNDMHDLEVSLASARAVFDGFATFAENVNGVLDFEEAKKSVGDLAEEVARLKTELRETGKVSIDTNAIEKARYELTQIANGNYGLTVDTSDVDELTEKARALRQELDEIQKRSEMGTPVWQPMVTATNRIRRGWSDIVNLFRRSGGFLNGLRASLRSCWDYVTRFRDRTKDAGNAGKSLGDIFKQAGGQLLGMASKVGIVLYALRQVSALVKEIAKNIEQARIDRLYGNAGAGADDMTRVRTRRDEQQQELIRKLNEFANLYDEERRTGTSESRAKRLNLQDELRDMYGFEFAEVNGEIRDMDAQIASKIDELTKSRIQAIDAQIDANQKVIDGATKYINSMGYWRRLVTPDYEGKIKEAQERSTRATDENLALREQRRSLANENLSTQFERLRTAKAADQNSKQEEEARNEAQKAQEERAKALEDANRKLEDWGNSLSDNDHQKGLREIIDKYNSLVQGGVNAEEARVVATKAIEELLKKERDEEEKHNRELVQALQDRIDQYKDAYQSYLASERDLQDARREERDLIRRQNRDRRAESLQRKRDRIQERLSRFGFTPYEGFRLDESETRRARRRRNAELDAGISEKMERSQAGERVSWTRQERQRILDYQRLQRRDKQLEAAQKQMDAAERQRQAADALKEAAKSINNAIAGRNEAIGNLRGNASELRGALGNRPVMSRNGRADQVLWNALRYGLNARGVSGAWSQNQGNYNQQLNQLHADLQQMQRNVYLVR